MISRLWMNICIHVRFKVCVLFFKCVFIEAFKKVNQLMDSFHIQSIEACWFCFSNFSCFIFLTCWKVASSNPSRLNSAIAALRKSCSCVDAHLKKTNHISHFSSQLPMHISTACITKVTKGLVSPDGSDVGRGKHLIQCFHHVTHSHQSCGGRVSSWVLTDLRCPPTDVQTSASITGQSGHLPDMRDTDVTWRWAGEYTTEQVRLH